MQTRAEKLSRRFPAHARQMPPDTGLSTTSAGPGYRTSRLASHWSWVVPLIGVALLPAALSLPFGVVLGIACSAALIGAVIAAVHHAEVVAHRVGEPFGTLVLALAVTAIESSL